MSNDQILSLLASATSSLIEANELMLARTKALPLPPSPSPSPISHSLTDLNYEVDWHSSEEGYVFDEDLYNQEGDIKSSAKLWYVPDFNELTVDVAVTNGTYGISIGSESGSTEEVRGPLGLCLVDKEAWAVAKGISVGDILFMVNHTTGKVLRGMVTDQPIKGPFCPMRSLENSFVACLGMFADVDLKKEVELVFKVDWTEHHDVDEYWIDFLQAVDPYKVLPLSDPFTPSSLLN